MSEEQERESMLTSMLKAVEVSKDAYKDSSPLPIDTEIVISEPPPGYGSVIFITMGGVEGAETKDEEEQEE